MLMLFRIKQYSQLHIIFNGVNMIFPRWSSVNVNFKLSQFLGERYYASNNQSQEVLLIGLMHLPIFSPFGEQLPHILQSVYVGSCGKFIFGTNMYLSKQQIKITKKDCGLERENLQPYPANTIGKKLNTLTQHSNTLLKQSRAPSVPNQL